MRARLAPWSRQLSDAILHIPPWTLLPPRRRGWAAGRPHARTLVHSGVPRACPHGTTVHGACRPQRRGWGAALAVGVLLTWLVSVPGAMAAQAAPPPPEAAVATAAVLGRRIASPPATITVQSAK